MSTIRVAIDGPSGAGKSTLARSAAGKLGFVYVDTGAIYRTIGLYVFRNRIDPEDGEAVAAALESIHVEVRYDAGGGQQMYLNGGNVSEEIRAPEISDYASKVGAVPAVRDYLMETQRSIARKHNVIMDGRDIGTVVLPDAEVKVFLTASIEARARRRMLDYERQGTPKPYEEVLREARERDDRDTHRAAAPLRQAEDAVVLDTTELDFAQSEEALLNIIRRRTKL